MDVILLERVEKLGQMGDVVKVKPGYARNYLIPQNKALRATDSNRARFEAEKVQLEAENLERRGEAEKVAEKMDGASVILVRQAGEAGQLYGSVNARDVADALKEDGYSVGRQQVQLAKPIKNLGMHPVSVRLHAEVAVTVTANVARSAEEAEVQERTGEAVVSQAEAEARADAEAAEALAAAEVAEAAAAEAVAEQADAIFEEGAAPNLEEEEEAPAEETAEEASDDAEAETPAEDTSEEAADDNTEEKAE
jgi:large subunit ribosomal protein L9